MTTRRELLIALGAGALATPLSAYAQQPGKVWRVGYIGGTPVDNPGQYFTTFREELQRLGYVDGKTIVIDYRASEGQLERIPGLVQELITARANVLVLTNVVAIRAAQRATTTIPIVMATSLDPIAAGFAQSLRQPGGNITGVSTLRSDLSAKLIELSKELIPGISRVAILWDTDGPGPRQRFQDYLAAAKALKLNIQSLEVKGPTADFEKAMQTAKSNRAQALIVSSNPFTVQHRQTVMSAAARHGLPSIVENSIFVEAGGLISYAADRDAEAKVLASMVARILKGAKPANLPIEQPTKFELVLNMKSAKALGLTIPQSIMLQATRIIE
jgi:putative ABC transport system substrate-binding protein